MGNFWINEKSWLGGEKNEVEDEREFDGDGVEGTHKKGQR